MTFATCPLGNQARTYGRIFGLTRKTLIDDDMDALSAVPRRLGIPTEPQAAR